MNPIIIIPARMASTRLPGKPRINPYALICARMTAAQRAQLTIVRHFVDV